jgi:squalene-associated FAD-dependent desaturase
MLETISTEIAIIGGGIAGLAAALRLHQSGAKIALIEKRPFFGGRAYSFKEPHTGETVDNGQHLLMGCYHETLDFLTKVGTASQLDFQKNLRISFAEEGRLHSLNCPNLPAPLHLAFGLLNFKGLKWSDKKQMLQLRRLVHRNGSTGIHWDEKSVLDFLKQGGQSFQAIENFWEPLALATLNESLEVASAELFREVLKRSLFSNKKDSTLLLSKVGLSDLYATPLTAYFKKHQVPCLFNTQVTEIEKQPGHFLIHNQNQKTIQTKKIIFATTPNALHKILEKSDGILPRLKQELPKFGTSPIVSINLWMRHFRPPDRMIGLLKSPMHWLFDKARIFPKSNSTHLTLVISGAHRLAQESKESLVALAIQELRRFFPEIDPNSVAHSQVIKELEATFSAKMGLAKIRPSAKSETEGIYLAGDWTDTGLPATIESAVLSGHRAAQLILQNPTSHH